MEKPFLIINYIDFRENELIVGATNNERWEWDREEGMSGVDAKTIVMTILENYPDTNGIGEKVLFFCRPGDEFRQLAMTRIHEMFEIAWEIKNEKLSQDEARDKYFGFELK
ncbi:MAG: hypothetical protein MI810_06485 [Flavobacteriales bacterium]|jgi:hypothetical protein|nr:hypothetical protein [Flavobacteriales bacterium]